MSNKPNISRRESEGILLENQTTDKVAIIAIRGYYADSFGKKGENDRNVYDDAIIVISRRKYETFQANTDPSIYRKHIAAMKTGVHRYYKGKHKNRYWALRLVGEQVPVTRDGESGDKIGVALNIHKGGNRTTGSEGCQTLMPADWDDFIELVYDEMDFYGQKTIAYVLIDEKDRRAGKYQMPIQLHSAETGKLVNALEPTVIDKPQVIPAIPLNNPPKVQNDQSHFETYSAKGRSVQLNETAESLAVPSVNDFIGKAQQTGELIGQTMQTYSSVKEITDELVQSKDGKKSLWTIISQTFLQIFWAIFGVFAGIPREVWLIVAVIVAGIAFYYLYRQITLGKIRETTRQKLVT